MLNPILGNTTYQIFRNNCLPNYRPHALSKIRYVLFRPRRLPPTRTTSTPGSRSQSNQKKMEPFPSLIFQPVYHRQCSIHRVGETFVRTQQITRWIPKPKNSETRESLKLVAHEVNVQGYEVRGNSRRAKGNYFFADFAPLSVINSRCKKQDFYAQFLIHALNSTLSKFTIPTLLLLFHYLFICLFLAGTPTRTSYNKFRPLINH